MNPPTALVFDIGNVIVRFDFSLTLKKVADQSEVANPAELLAKIDHLKQDYEVGSIDRSTFLSTAFDLLRYRGTEADFITAWEEIFQPNLPICDLVERLHGRFPLFLLSNTGDLHHAYLFRTYPVFSRFTAGTYSYLAGAAKPGPEIYEQAIRDHRLVPSDTVFIDDLLPNIRTAQALGFRTHHYDHTAHNALEADLAAWGIIL